MAPSPRKLAPLAELDRTQNQNRTVKHLHTAMAALRLARLQVRQAQRFVAAAKLEGRPAMDRLDDVAELLHHYTDQLRRQADALASAE